MRGPIPKDPALRQRRNKATTAAVLPQAEVLGRIEPPLPARGPDQTPWHPETQAYWKEVWASPQASQFLPVHVPRLVMLFKIIDAFNYGDLDRMAEIRMQSQCFGLTPLDERRLEWTRGERKKRPVDESATAVAPPAHDADPRRTLRAVK